MNADPVVVARVIDTLFEMTVKGTLILAIAGVATTWAMRRAAAATRHLVWSTAVAAVLALPFAQSVVPHWSVPGLPALRAAVPGLFARALVTTPVPAPVAPLLAPTAPANAPANASTPSNISVSAAPALDARIALLSADAQRLADALAEKASTGEVGGASAVNASTRNDPTGMTTEEVTHVQTPRASARPFDGPAAADRRARSFASVTSSFALPRVSSLTLLLLLWATGALLVLARLVLGALSLSRVGRRAQPVEDAEWLSLLNALRRSLGIRRPVALLVGGADAVPMTWGILSPVVLLPPDAMAWSEGRRRAVLLHELAHVERFDMLTHFMSQLALAALWFHPLAMLAARRLRAERERACDDLVLAAGGIRATAYADDLLTLVQTLGTSRSMSAGLAMARRSEFEGRLLSILDPTAPRVRTDRRRALVAALLVSVALLPLAGMQTAEAAESAPMLRPLVGPLSPGDEGPLYRGESPWNKRTAPAAPSTEAKTAADSVLPRLRPMAPMQFRVDVSSTSNGARMMQNLSGILAAPAAHAQERGASAVNAEPKAYDGGVQDRSAQEALPPEVIADLARAVSGMTSDSDKAAVLLKLAPRAGETADVRRAFFGAMKSMVTCSDKRRVLLPVVARFGDDSTLAAVLEIVKGMTTDSDRSLVLVAVAGKRRLSDPLVRTRFFDALESVTSESSRAAALLAAVNAQPDDLALQRAVISSSGRLTSESTRANVLLAVATSTPALRDVETRARFIDMLGRFTSGSEYRRVMDAVVK